jgi:hypothetical protein
MTSRRLLKAILFAMSSTCPAFASAVMAQAAPVAATNEQLVVVASRSEARQSEIGITSTLPALLSGVAIEAGQADGKATINFSQKQGNQSLVTTLSTPVSKDAKATDFASLDGLASDLSFSLAYTGFYIPLLAAGQEAIKLVGVEQFKVCSSYGADLDECEAEGLIRAAALKCGINGVKDRTLVPPSKLLGKLSELLLSAADTQRSCFEALRGRALDDFDFASFQGKMIGSWAVTGEVARKPATFFQADGSKRNETNVPFSLAGAYGLIGRNVRYSLSGRYESRFKDGKSVTRCQPFAGGAASADFESCTQLPFAAPVRANAFVASAEARWFFKSFAVSPVVSYDFKEKVLGLQVPIYLVRNSTGDLTGGIRFGWRDDTHDLSTAVFVSKPLSLRD